MTNANRQRTMSTAPSAGMEQELLSVKSKIYPRAVTGRFANWRATLVLFTQLLYYGLPWLSWDGRQAVLFDLAERKFYILGMVFWPQDFIYLTGLLVAAALSLFLFTAIAGRLWCGFACPQTVYTELFLWIERNIEGDRPRQMKLDRMPWNAEKIGKKSAKHAAWLALALWTGFTFVGYFTPIRELAQSFVQWTLGPWQTFWIFFYGFATYGNAGFMREQVCKYMCPYARFQSVMFDSDTLTVTYDPNRGEPRGARARNVDYKAKGLGDCVDCGICVQVCPTGIDIRNGLQYECIGCAACIDACNQVMGKMGYPKGLIRYTTENVIQGNYPDSRILSHVLRPRTLVYSVVLLAIVTALGSAIINRVPLRVDAIRDRIAARETADGLIENVYRLQIINMENKPHRYSISVAGLPGAQLAEGSGQVAVPALGTHTVVVHVRVAPDAIKEGSNPVQFQVQAADDPDLASNAHATFISR